MSENKGGQRSVETIRLVASDALIETMVNERPPLVKVLVAGAPDVGKTSLVNSLIFEGFTKVTPTIGVNFAQKICYGERGPVNLSIWDLSGHPRFRCLMPRFCRGATGVILVFDLTAPESLEAADQWLKRLSSDTISLQEYTVVLVGNKVDLPPNIQQETIRTFCATHHIKYYIQSSAKTGKNVKHIFETLCSVMQREHLGLTEHAQTLAQSPT